MKRLITIVLALTVVFVFPALAFASGSVEDGWSGPVTSISDSKGNTWKLGVWDMSYSGSDSRVIDLDITPHTSKIKGFEPADDSTLYFAYDISLANYRNGDSVWCILGSPALEDYDGMPLHWYIEDVNGSVITLDGYVGDHQQFIGLLQSEKGDAAPRLVACIASWDNDWNAAADSDTPTDPFIDVPSDSWYADAVAYVNDLNIMKGYDNGQFGPLDPLSRCQFATILWRYAEPDAAKRYDQNTAYNSTDLSDIAAKQYWTGAANWIVRSNIMTGYSGTDKFGPNDPLTFEQMITILWRYFGKSTTDVDRSILNAYPDSNQISSYAKDAMAWAVQNNIAGNASLLEPGQNVYRARAAMVLYNGLTQGVFH